MQNTSYTNEKPMKIAILISGRGSNMEAILRHIAEGRLRGVTCVGVLSDRADAGGLAKAKEFGVPALFLDPGPKKTVLDPEKEAAYARQVQAWGADLVVLAGFMRVLKEPFLSVWGGRALNIHPSLLPKFPGLDVQRRAIEAGETQSGCTVHWVDRGVDTGAILGQRTVPIQPGDDEKALAARILVEEHVLYSDILGRLADGRIPLPGRPR